MKFYIVLHVYILNIMLGAGALFSHKDGVCMSQNVQAGGYIAKCAI